REDSSATRLAEVDWLPRVITFTVARKALAPYSEDSGPLAISTRSIIWTGMNSGPRKAVRSGRKLTGTPLIITFTMRVPARRPPEMPRTDTDGMTPSSTTYRPGTDWRISATDW